MIWTAEKLRIIEDNIYSNEGAEVYRGFLKSEFGPMGGEIVFLLNQHGAMTLYDMHDRFWPEESEAACTAKLRVAICTLRKKMEAKDWPFEIITLPRGHTEPASYELVKRTPL